MNDIDMKATTHTLLVFTDNSPGVLQRLTIMFTRRKLNIESLTVSETEQHARSRFTIVVRCDLETAEKVAGQLKKMVETQDVLLCSDREVCFREVALYKIQPLTTSKRTEFDACVREHAAHLIEESASGLVVEKTGVEDEVQMLLAALKPFGVKEFVRSGRIALLKSDRAPEFEQIAHQEHATQADSDSWL